MITVYTMHMCGGCEALKTFLRELDVEFAERPLMDSASITELRMSGCYEKVESLQAPILQIGDRVMRYDDLFLEGELDKKAVESFSEAEAEGMTSLPIGDVLGFLGELKAEIEGEGEADAES